MVFSARKARPLVGWALLLFIVLFWRLGAPSFWDPDEAHYAETTRELIRTGDWTTPYYNEQPFFDKPILFHLLQAVPMAVLGENELAARLVPAVAALALVLITAWLGATLAGADVAAVAALLLAVSPGLFALARYAILDTVFTAFVFGGASLVTVAALTDRRRLQWPGYVAIAFAVLTKGPLAIVLCGLTFLLAIAISRDARQRLLRLNWIAGLAIVVAISAPWFLWMWHRWDRAFVDGYVLNENLRLFGTSMYARQPGFWFYFQILAAGLLPWTALLVGRVFDDVRRTIQPQSARYVRDPAPRVDRGRRRLLHDVEVQARSLRLSGRAVALPVVRARVDRRARTAARCRATPALASDCIWSARFSWRSAPAAGIS